MTEYDIKFRMILVGESSVGKTSLLRAFDTGECEQFPEATMGVDFAAHPFTMEDGKKGLLQIFDTAGQELYHSLTTSYFRNVRGVLLVYDILDMNSFKNMDYWFSEAQKQVHPDSPVFALVGCKLDRMGENVELYKTIKIKAMDFALRNKTIFIETSARVGVNVKEAFHKLASEMYSQKHFTEVEHGLSLHKIQTPPVSTIDPEIDCWSTFKSFFTKMFE